ncbi:uncharacterized protein LOC111309709 [Durio zibethinus]|uniref:Uncharacterized protein LOC111309709 n=1 Tax=Durio zibethinus TaxID=66656 RepID=A0A6P6AI24_DURZI|nr:uncharacterized protein LOC111309709 [Durio zibethinus]
MASLFITTSISSVSPSLPLYPPISPATFRPLHVPTPVAVAFSSHVSQRKTRALAVVTRAGPNTSSYVFAVAFPLSLLAVTIFTSIKIADKLDKDFLEYFTISQAIREADEEDDDDDDDDDDGDDVISLEDIVQEPVLPRTRNRPKREV